MCISPVEFEKFFPQKEQLYCTRLPRVVLPAMRPSSVYPARNVPGYLR